MTTMAASRKTISVHDYPEHLNPFREDDNHNKIRFWTIGRRSRSNSINFSGIKDFRNSWSLRSFMKKGKKSEQYSEKVSNPVQTPSKTNNHVNGDSSPIVFRRAMQYSSMSRSTIGSPGMDRYVYGGSVTPLPRSRFQERLRSSQQDINNSPSATPRMARSDIMGSRLSLASTNPFDEPPIPPVRASRRKKNRAPPPPPIISSTVTEDSANTSVTSELCITESEKADAVNVLDELNLKVELKIVEDEDNHAETDSFVVTTDKYDEKEREASPQPSPTHNGSTEIEVDKSDQITEISEKVKSADSEDDILNKVSFSKVNINRYRRNSSVNEDDIRLRRGNLEDFNLSNKRSKSLTNTIDGSYTVYNIDLNDNNNIDENCNEEPKKVICKIYEERKQSIDNSVSSTEKEFIEIDKATRELEREISKLNSALNDEELSINEGRLSVSDIKRKFDRSDMSSPNPIPKPRRSHYGGSSSPINHNSET